MGFHVFLNKILLVFINEPTRVKILYCFLATFCPKIFYNEQHFKHIHNHGYKKRIISFVL